MYEDNVLCLADVYLYKRRNFTFKNEFYNSKCIRHFNLVSLVFITWKLRISWPEQRRFPVAEFHSEII
jgi:hypothetical protein